MSIIHFGFYFLLRCLAEKKPHDDFSRHHTNSDMHIVQKLMFFKLMPNFYINVILKRNPLIKALVKVNRRSCGTK